MSDNRAIAIIGMSCAFAGSPNTDAFWHTIRNGSAHFREVPAERWDHSRFYSPNPRDLDMTYARKLAFLDDIRSFAPERYGIPPKRAYLMDPQQRLFLDQTRLALDDAGYGARSLPRSTGVYVGASVSEYKDLILSRVRTRQILGGQLGRKSTLSDTAVDKLVQDVAAMQQYSLIGSLLNMIACSVSEAFDLQGPALALDAACSSSLVALQEAVLHLRERACDAAVVGGVNIVCSPDTMIGFSKIGALSRRDECRPFDSGADGFVVGEGLGALVLKRLPDAVRDHDRVRAILRGVGLNNDGRGDGPMTPRMGGQLGALARAYQDAEINPETVSYVEAHGTATPVGDKTEILALMRHMGSCGSRRPECGVASVKGNIGHTLAAAGVAGVIKAVLMLEKHQIPPQAGWQEARAALELDGSGFYIPHALKPFDRRPDSPRRIGVSSFGFGGTNVHVLLEESLEEGTAPPVWQPDPCQLFLISAPSKPLLAQHLDDLVTAIDISGDSLSSIAFTLTVARRREKEQVAFVASSRRELKEKLLKASLASRSGAQDDDIFMRDSSQKAQPHVAFLFTGDAEQTPAELRSFLSRFPEIRSRVEALATERLPSGTLENGISIDAVQIAMAGYLAELGLAPKTIIGVRSGEVIAAACSGRSDPRLLQMQKVETRRRLRPSARTVEPENGVLPHVGEPLHLACVLPSQSHQTPQWERCYETPDPVFSWVSATLRNSGVDLLLKFGRGNVDPNPSQVCPPVHDGNILRTLHLLDHGKNDLSEEFLSLLGRLATLGFALNVSSLYKGAKPVSMPSAPLPTRVFWIADPVRRPKRTGVARKADKSTDLTFHQTGALVGDSIVRDGVLLAQVAAASSDTTTMSKGNGSMLWGFGESVTSSSSARGTAMPSSSEGPKVVRLSEIEGSTLDRLKEIVTSVSGYRTEDLKPEHKLGADLGFDSMMAVDLQTSILETFEGAGALPQTVFGGETNLESLAQALEALLTDRDGMVASKPGNVKGGPQLEDKQSEERSEIKFSVGKYPWLKDHQIQGHLTVPFAFLLDQALAASRRLGGGPILSLSQVEMFRSATCPLNEDRVLEVLASGNASATQIRVNLITEQTVDPVMQAVVTDVSSALPSLACAKDSRTPALSLREFYRDRTFHGPSFHALSSVDQIGPAHISGWVDPLAVGRIEGATLDILTIDAMMQLGAFWASVTLGQIGLPVGAKEIRILGSPETTGLNRIQGVLDSTSVDQLIGSFDLTDSKGLPLVQIRQLKCKLIGSPRVGNLVDRFDKPERVNRPDPSTWRINEFPEVRALEQRMDELKKASLPNPYFSIHQSITNDTSVIAGQEYINFSSYNYLGFSGDPEVATAAIEAVHRYGTSVSASRLASGEKPLHRELENAISEFLGCEDAIVMVGGHATNVSVIGHLLGPQDMVIHDSLAHDSIIAGIRLSGARRRSFPHNDLNFLEDTLRKSRESARRVLIAIEGVYSMDGDVPPLPEIIELKQRYHALLLVDEAHSLGVLGKTGRGIGEFHNVVRGDVDLWMGTLSKSLASCGGYIAGSGALIQYLKYTNPGFVYSVGISPANAGAALASLQKLKGHPELVNILRTRSYLFYELSQEYGLDTGLSCGTAIVPCIVGDSRICLQLSHSLGQSRINVQPILHPAVDEHLARLRFFLTARHSVQQIATTVKAVAETLAELSPRPLRTYRGKENIT